MNRTKRPRDRVGARTSALTLSLAMLALAAGCGPFGYLKKVARDADREVGKAEAAGAEEHAPYEYWGAKAYLEQSKVMMGYSEYERSFDYGDRAVQLAKTAEEKALREIDGGNVQTVGENDEGMIAPEKMPDAPAEDTSATEDAGGDK